MPIAQDGRYLQSVVAGPINSGLFSKAQASEESPAVLDVLASAARQSTLAGAAYDRFTMPDPDLPDAPPRWDPLDHIQGFEHYANDLADAQTPSHLEGMKARLQSREADLQTLQKARLGGVTAGLAFAILDPSFLAGAAIPELAAGRSVALAKTLTATVRGAAGAGAYEGGLQTLQDGRTATESLVNVGTGALLSGVMGHLLNRVPVSESKALRKTIEAEADNIRSESGAAAVARPTTLEAESIARGARGLSKAMAKTPLLGTDLDRVMVSDSVTARTALQELADVPQMLEKNTQGIATPVSVEALSAKHEARVADFMDHARDQWKIYRERVPKSERISKGDFYTSIASASRRGDKIGIPEVDSAAQMLRSRVFDPLKDEAQKLGLLEDPVKKAQAKAEEKAVDQYFRAQESQLFADYRGRTRAAIREGKGLEGDAAEAGQKVDEIRTELERALKVEEDIKGQTLESSQSRVKSAQEAYDQTIYTARADLEATFAAAKSDAELLASQAAEVNAGRADQFALGIETAKHAREISIANATELVEKAQREHQALSQLVRRDMPRDKARIEILKSRLQIEGVRREAARALIQARKDYGDVVKALKSQFGAKDIPKLSDRSTNRAVREFRRLSRQERKTLEAARAAEGRVSKAERRRYSLAARKLKKTAESQIDEIEISSIKKFRKRAEAVASGGADADPAVLEMARLIKDRQGGRLSSRVTIPSIDAEKVARPLGAESYFRRMYDREAIRANMAEWRDVLYNWFANQGKAEPAEIAAAVEDVTRKILHADVGQANFATQVTVSAAGPLKERTLAVPDELIEKFLVNDPVKVASAYVRELAPQVELAKRFGDVDMKQRLQDISDEYNVKREQARTSMTDQKALSKELDRLTTQEKETLEALVRIRDRVLGTAGRIDPNASEGQRRAVAAARGWRNLVASARLGGTALTGGIMDTAKIAAQYGFLPTIKKLTQLISSKAFRDLSRTQTRRVGSAVETALARRVQVAYDGAITEGWTQTLANSVYKYTGLNHATDFNRTLAATLFEDSVLKAAARAAAGKSLKAFERTRLASLGLGDEELQAISREIVKHGGEVDGIRVSGSADWGDKRLADIYDAAILKETKITVQQPGAADRVWWLDKETGKLLGQLKTFSLSSPTRLLAGGLQAAGHGAYGQAARFFGFMMMGGYLTHVTRNLVAGKTPSTDPKTAASEAISESGLLGVMPDVLSPVGRKFGLAGGVRYSDRNISSAYGGPALGALTDFYDVAFNRTEGGISAADLHAIRRLLPYNNVWFLRREINALEGELAESLDLQGSDTASFGERMMRTEALPNASK